ncbi:hypothetical protein TrLO_g1017 [Triparma laevis f. longispina]|uniref:Uncharacterized protein n=1 Tax=Triparma laevis f. longispina TaxID=1714387 RepID=A0A9W7ASY9_9STRA|nr:hypothetical protein TrLO_g1017 [Triparma laevis f. longispina]
MTIPDSLQTHGDEIFEYRAKLVPYSIDVSYAVYGEYDSDFSEEREEEFYSQVKVKVINSQVIAHLRSKQQS